MSNQTTLASPNQPKRQERLHALIMALAHGLIERDAEVRLALLACLAGEHVLLIGPPGTAKSELARRLHAAFAHGHYFERLLTKFSVPDELFGPLSLAALEQDRYERKTKGYLPQAHIAFIDEIFKANSAILNALLTLLNEREFDQGDARIKVPLRTLLAASNELPSDAALSAVLDRFLVQLTVKAVSEEGFKHLLALPHAAVGIDKDLAIEQEFLEALTKEAHKVALPPPIIKLMGELRNALNAKGVVVSDRRYRKWANLLKVAAAAEGRTEIIEWDLALGQYALGLNEADGVWLADWYAKRMVIHEAIHPKNLDKAVSAFEAQFQIEKNATELAFDDSGKLSFTRSHEQLAAMENAPRLSSTQRQRRYGAKHISARCVQIEALAITIKRYQEALMSQHEGLRQYQQHALWLSPAFIALALSTLAQSVDNVAQLATRLEACLRDFKSLPLHEVASDQAPDDVTW